MYSINKALTSQGQWVFVKVVAFITESSLIIVKLLWFYFDLDIFCQTTWRERDRKGDRERKRDERERLGE